MRIQGGAKSVRGSLSFAGDKSCAHRALILGALASGRTAVSNFPHSEDVLSTVRCLKGLGVTVSVSGTGAVINGVGLRGLRAPAGELDCGNSGTTMRLLCGILAGQNFRATLSGDASLLRRPMDRVAIPLGLMGARFGLKHGLPPVTVRGGPLNPVTYLMPLPSAQVKSAILLAGLYADGVTTVVEPLPSRDHTENMLPLFGASVFRVDGQCSVLGGSRLCAADLRLPGDFSSAAFFIAAAAALPGSVFTAESVILNSLRLGLVSALRKMGADIILRRRGVMCGEVCGDVIVRGRKLRGRAFGPADIPQMIDELPALAVAAAFAGGLTVISGAQELRRKESDRIKAAAAFLSALGVHAAELPDGLAIEGGRPLRAALLPPCSDHRICMAAALAASFAVGTSELEGTGCAAVSYPSFFADLRKVRHA